MAIDPDLTPVLNAITDRLADLEAAQIAPSTALYDAQKRFQLAMSAVIAPMDAATETAFWNAEATRLQALVP